MSELKKYSTFEALKSDVKNDQKVSSKANKSLLKFEALLHSLQRIFSAKQPVKTKNGK